MIPLQTLSSRAVQSAFLPPRNVVREPLIDYELGGVALQDPSQGLKVQTWRAEVIGDDVVLAADNVPPAIVFTQPGITEIALAFDQNMQPFLAYMINDDEAKFRWFDTQVGDFVVNDLPAGSYSVRCTLDDKRSVSGTLLGRSDIILTYLRGGTLYMRAQRDRYQVEYALATDLDRYEIGQFGMSRNWRLQWQLVPLPQGAS